MPTINNKKYLNLQEQVLKNKNDIAAIIAGNVVLGELGIKVVGQVESTALLPNPASYPGEYGDAYLVGHFAPYDYYIFTRPFYGQTTPQWFNLGEFPLPGPDGQPGIGITPRLTIGVVNDGENASATITGTETEPVLNLTLPRGRKGEDGRAGISCTHEWVGTTLYVTSASGTTASNLRGPQGEQALPIKIIAELPSVSALPDAIEANRQKAYLIPINGVLNLYALVGEIGGVLTWTNLGPMAGSAGTEITVGGNVVPQWNADQKLDKSNYSNAIYGTTSTGSQEMYTIDSENHWPLEGTTTDPLNVVRRDASGNITVPAPVNNTDAVNKQYLQGTLLNWQMIVFNTIYPVGAIYLSMNRTNPATLFGVGSWEPIKAKFLVGVDENINEYYYAGKTGGSADATLPAHSHNFIGTGGEIDGYNLSFLMRYNSSATYRNPAWNYGSYGTDSGQLSIGTTGSDATNANLPPYMAVYMWQRIS